MPHRPSSNNALFGDLFDTALIIRPTVTHQRLLSFPRRYSFYRKTDHHIPTTILVSESGQVLTTLLPRTNTHRLFCFDTVRSTDTDRHAPTTVLVPGLPHRLSRTNGLPVPSIDTDCHTPTTVKHQRPFCLPVGYGFDCRTDHQD